jgi:hypothetical protein
VLPKAMALGLKTGLAAAALAVVGASLGGCATPSYAGVSLAPGAADPEVQALARRAQAGDKQAQLELGMRYEEARGLPRDLERAKSLYAAAATSSTQSRLAYVPAAGPGGRPMTVPISSGAAEPGLPEAQRRLDRLRGIPAAGGEEPPSQARNGGVAARVVSDLVLMDGAFDQCSAAATDGYDGDRFFREVRSCLWRKSLPSECGAYANSLLKVKAVTYSVSELNEFDAAAGELIRSCGAALPASPRYGMSLIDRLLGKDIAPRQSEVSDMVHLPPSDIYLSRLCPGIFEDSVEDVRLSEVLICSVGGKRPAVKRKYDDIIGRLRRQEGNF